MPHHPAVSLKHSFAELDRPQVFDHQQCSRRVIIQFLADHLDIFNLDHSSDFNLERVEHGDRCGIQLLQLEGLIFAILNHDDDQVDHPHNLVFHQLTQRWKDLATELITLEFKR